MATRAVGERTACRSPVRPRLAPERRDQSGHKRHPSQHGRTPVSYTHLDVYKRQIFGAVDAGATANGRTVLSAGLTLGLLGLPVIIISAQEAIRAVPPSLRQASFGLGATKWQTVRYHVLPNAIAGILTGVILSMSRIIGETAPLVVVGASTFITTDPTGPFSKFTTLPSQIYQWTARPQDTFRDIAAATIVVLLVLLLLLNATAIFLRNRYSKRLG